ncbi:MAG: hypothetical protein AW07_02227 [Candidatus Accumulibacter sp. SK-11]|nr:MAG: hypothetical protein AW07_02227 [Candidatus Accumulibacter sp. SK-11]
MSYSRPSLASNTRWPDSETILCSTRQSLIGSLAGTRVSSCTTRKTSPAGQPLASALGQPVRLSATGFM